MAEGFDGLRGYYGLQDFVPYCPKNNWFLKTKLKLYERKKNANINYNETPVVEYEISNYEILSSSNYDVKKYNWYFEKNKYADKYGDKKPPKGAIGFSMMNLSSITSYFQNPNTDFHLEGKRIHREKPNFNQKELNISIFRLKRVIILTKKFFETIGTILWFKYPIYSLLILAFWQIFLLFMN